LACCADPHCASTVEHAVVIDSRPVDDLDERVPKDLSGLEAGQLAVALPDRGAHRLDNDRLAHDGLQTPPRRQLG
jgi:hypothetical protein